MTMTVIITWMAIVTIAMVNNNNNNNLFKVHSKFYYVKPKMEILEGDHDGNGDDDLDGKDNYVRDDE